jgi:hypothetical protein
MFVYLWSGEVKEMPQATSLSVVGKLLLFFSGKELVGSLPQSQVQYCSKINISPFPS